MANVALFYENATPVTAERHGNWSITKDSGFAFSRNTHFAPVTAVEFARAAREYPLVFAQEGEQAFPVAVLGLKERENLYITESGEWDAAYVPAFVRRYPFIFASDAAGEKFTLCIDESFAGCNEEGDGERLFLKDGARSAYLDSTLAFLEQYQIQFQLTRAFSDRVRELGLLEPVQANIALKSGQRIALGGFLTVNRDRLKSADGDTLSALVKQDHLELLYTHLYSLNNFSRLMDRFAAETGNAPDPVG